MASSGAVLKLFPNDGMLSSTFLLAGAVICPFPGSIASPSCGVFFFRIASLAGLAFVDPLFEIRAEIFSSFFLWSRSF